jgi:hypothetical protein
VNHPSTPALAGRFETVDVCLELEGRVCETMPCGNPLCDCRRDPSVLFAYSEVGRDRWVVGRYLPRSGVEDLVNSFDEEGARNMLATSILFGVPWRFFDDAGVLDVLTEHQRTAYSDTPDWYFERDPEELRRVRAAINEVDPLPVLHLLRLSFFVGREIGGGHGPTP